MQEPLKEQILRNLTDTSKLNTTIKINVTKKINELKIKEDKLLDFYLEGKLTQEITVAFYIYFIRSSRIGNLLPAGKSKIPCFNLFIHKFSRHLDCRTPGQKRQYFYDTFGSLQKDYIGLFIKIPEGF